jgi:hypothetical protein
MGFEPTITASERAKTVHVLDYSATVTGSVTRIALPFYVAKYEEIAMLYNHTGIDAIRDGN